MIQSHSSGIACRAAVRLLESHGPASANEAAERAEERFANIDLGGFGFWKSVEKLIREQRVTL